MSSEGIPPPQADVEIDPSSTGGSRRAAGVSAKPAAVGKSDTRPNEKAMDSANKSGASVRMNDYLRRD
jgi:hypothetical protein